MVARRFVSFGSNNQRKHDEGPLLVRTKNGTMAKAIGGNGSCEVTRVTVRGRHVQRGGAGSGQPDGLGGWLLPVSTTCGLSKRREMLARRLPKRQFRVVCQW